MRQQFILANQVARKGAILAVQDAPDGSVVEIRPKTRSLEQNALLWACLTELSSKVDWYGTKLQPEEWKDVLTAALKKSKVVPGLDGGFVVLGQRTSKMTKAEFSELLELMFAFGAERGVEFHQQAPAEYAEWLRR